MGTTRNYLVDWMLVYANVASTGDNGFTPGSGWQAASKAKRARCRGEMRQRTGNIELIPAMQFANDPDSPDNTPIVLGSTWTSTNGPIYPSAQTDATSTATTRQLVRFGWVTRNTSLTNLSLAMVTGTFEVED